MIIPIASMAVLYIGGDNVGLVPDMAAMIGHDIYAVIAAAYLFCTAVTAVLAWIGAKTRQELAITIKRMYGETGRRWWAVLTLGVCVPASAITGILYTGQLFHALAGWPVHLTGMLCVPLYMIFAAGYGKEWLKLSNYLGLLTAPIMVYIAWTTKGSAALTIGMPGRMDWFLLGALIGYNIGGVRPALIVEMAAALARYQIRPVFLSVAAKLAEGCFTLLAGGITLVSTVRGPMAILDAARGWLPNSVMLLFAFSVFCIFINVMAPAVLVNSKQIGVLTGFDCRQSMLMAGIALYIMGLLPLDWLLWMLNGFGFASCFFIGCLAYSLHKFLRKSS